jgi:phosphoribosylanthranilate isomerase
MNGQQIYRPQVKICGLTCIEDALGCVELGADALGFVFFAKSPRNISPENARDIIRRIPPGISTVGVFVNESYSAILQKVDFCGLSAVQLHGYESPELVERLCRQSLLVIKALFSGKSPDIGEVARYQAHAYLVECGKGALPGGNAQTWNWGEAKSFGQSSPFILAGGLSPENVSKAVSDSLPDAVDVSSGVEECPGRKDLGKVERFIQSISGMGDIPFGKVRKPTNIFGQKASGE